jgi:hypothetical protein
MPDFRPFLTAYPPDDRICCPVDGARLARLISSEFGVCVPAELITFWSDIGVGYFGQRELYFFDDGERGFPRSSIIEWNKKAFWEERWPENRPGQLLFFAETCFGEQIGYSRHNDIFSVHLCSFDTAENYLVTQSFQALFEDILAEPHVFVEPTLLSKVRKSLGPLPDGMHYAPIISPLLGGSAHPRNYHFESPDVHLLAAVAAIQQSR